MNVATKIKHAPRWAWLTAGGVILGAGAVRLYRNRTTADSEDGSAPTSDATATGSGSGLGYGAGGVGGVIVPPVIVSGGDTDQSGTGLSDLQNLYFGGVQGLLDAVPTVYSQVWGPTQAQQLGITDSLLGNQTGIIAQLLADAGSAPRSVQDNPTPLVSPTPTPTPPIIPTVTSSVPQTTAKKCPAKYPHKSSRGCFRVECEKKGKTRRKGEWHIYENGTKLWVGSKCD